MICPDIDQHFAIDHGPRTDIRSLDPPYLHAHPANETESALQKQKIAIRQESTVRRIIGIVAHDGELPLQRPV
ncbi:hypothetical protein D3C80_2206700 [compost metagenome]